MRNLIVVLLSLSIGFLLGQQSIINAYDPKVLEEVALQHIRIVYGKGCVEGLKKFAFKEKNLQDCIELSRKTVENNEEIFRAKIWEKKR